MPKGLLIGGLLLIVWGIVAMGTPEITVDQPVYDFGSIGLGYMVKHTFILQNTGDQVLEILYVRSSCGCSTTDLPIDRLAPGESVPLEVLVVADDGAIKDVKVYIHTNAPDEYGRANDDRRDVDITLRVKGVITPDMQDYEIAPFELAYDMMLLIDVRDATSYAANHLISAINIPAGDLPSRMTSLPRSALIIVYDLAGETADAAVQTLVNGGYMSAYYLEGGLSHWVEVQGDRYLVNSAPLPTASGSVSSGSSRRPWTQAQLKSDFYVLIDLRDADAYAAGHLAGAMNILPAQLPQWFNRIPQEKRIILYDDGGTLTIAAYQILDNAGFRYTRVLLGGLNEWIYQYGEEFVITY
jgi:rhodanese-related sulfurtransferase